MSILKRLFGKKDNAEEAQHDASKDLNFAPHMPEVEESFSDAELDEILQYAREMAKDQEKRNVVTITPGRLVYHPDVPAPLKETMPPDYVARLESFAPTTKQLSIIAIGMTELRAFSADPGKAVPFMGWLAGLAQIGHAVLLFEGHSSLFAKICCNADLLIVDGGMIPFLQSNWIEVARSAMRDPRILVFDRNGTIATVKT